MTEKPKYTMSIDMNVLEHLGIGLYSNIPAILSEVCANAYDADAKNVWIETSNTEIIIQDDGHGMTSDDINKRFLCVGYKRRKEEKGTTPGGRQPMGRKGVGKLAPFSIANIIKVETLRENEKCALLMSSQDIQDNVSSYHPEEIATDEIKFKTGTRITLSELETNPTKGSIRSLKQRLSRRFFLHDENFKIHVNGKEVTAADRGYYNKVQHVWTYDDKTVSLLGKEIKKGVSPEQRKDSLSGLSGWIGTLEKPSTSKDASNESLNRIAIFVRGRMASENILSDMEISSSYYSQYLVGELRYDALDTYDGKGDEDRDAITTDRQSLQEEDPRVTDLKNFLRKELKYIDGSWREHRAEGHKREIKKIFPALGNWLDSYKGKKKEAAEKWISDIQESFSRKSQKDKKEILKVGALSFVRADGNGELDRLKNAPIKDIMPFLVEANSIQQYEQASYGEVIKTRLKIINELKKKVDDNDYEKEIQGYIFENIWLLDPSWDPATEDSKQKEKTLKKILKDVLLNKAEEDKRIDITYRKAGGKYIIIELKRPGASTKEYTLREQVDKYVSAFKKGLTHYEENNATIEAVILLGKSPAEWDTERKRIEKTLDVANARILFYPKLIGDAANAYRDCLAKYKNDVLFQVMEG